MFGPPDTDSVARIADALGCLATSGTGVPGARRGGRGDGRRLPREPARATDEHVAAVEEAAGGPCVHVLDADATWASAADRHREVVPARRSPEVRRLQMRVVDELAGLARTLPGGDALTYRSLDLAEIARYDWYSRLDRPSIVRWCSASSATGRRR